MHLSVGPNRTRTHYRKIPSYWPGTLSAQTHCIKPHTPLRYSHTLTTTHSPTATHPPTTHSRTNIHQSPTHPPTHPLTQSPTHPLTHSPTHPLTHLLMTPSHSPTATQPPTQPANHPPTHPPTHSEGTRPPTPIYSKTFGDACFTIYNFRFFLDQ